MNTNEMKQTRQISRQEESDQTLNDSLKVRFLEEQNHRLLVNKQDQLVRERQMRKFLLAPMEKVQMIKGDMHWASSRRPLHCAASIGITSVEGYLLYLPPLSEFKYLKAQEKGKDLIQSNFTTLIAAIDVSDLAKWLSQQGILTKEELAGSGKTTRQILVDLFQRKDDKWVPIFMNILKTNYCPLYRLVVGTDQNLCKLQRHMLLARLYQSGVSEDYTANILRENIRRNIARLCRSYYPRDVTNQEDNQEELILLLGRSDIVWVFPFVKFCSENLQKMAFRDIFGI